MSIQWVVGLFSGVFEREAVVSVSQGCEKNQAPNLQILGALPVLRA